MGLGFRTYHTVQPERRSALSVIRREEASDVIVRKIFNKSVLYYAVQMNGWKLLKVTPENEGCSKSFRTGLIANKVFVTANHTRLS